MKRVTNLKPSEIKLYEINESINFKKIIERRWVKFVDYDIILLKGKREDEEGQRFDHILWAQLQIERSDCDYKALLLKFKEQTSIEIKI